MTRGGCHHHRSIVNNSFSLPSRGSFHLSLTVLFSIGHWVVFSLGGWSPLLHTGFLVSGPTPVAFLLLHISPTGLLPPSARISILIRLYFAFSLKAPLPLIFITRFRLLPFRSPLLRESIFLSFLQVQAFSETQLRIYQRGGLLAHG